MGRRVVSTRRVGVARGTGGGLVTMARRRGFTFPRRGMRSRKLSAAGQRPRSGNCTGIGGLVHFICLLRLQVVTGKMVA